MGGKIIRYAREAAKQENTMGTKCRHCGVLIPKDARVCPYCRKNLGIPFGLKIFLGMAAVFILGMAMNTYYRDYQVQGRLAETEKISKDPVRSEAAWYVMAERNQCLFSEKSPAEVAKDDTSQGIACELKDDVLSDKGPLQVSLYWVDKAGVRLHRGTYYHGLKGYELCQKQAAAGIPQPAGNHINKD
jgi:hypothetical protein